MGKKRVHELAKEFGLENKDAVTRLQAAGLDVKSHSSSVYEDEARAVLMKGAEAPPPSPTLANAPKRPGMMIVKKKTAEELAAEAAAAEAAAAEAAAIAAAEAAAAAEAEAAEAAEMGLDAGDAQDVGDEDFAPEGEPEAPAPETVQARQDVVAREAAPAHQAPSAGPTPAAHAPAAPVAPMSQPGGPTANTRPGAAQVVRMIDRDKLMERVPSRRLGGGSGPGGPRPTGPRPAGSGPGGQRFGQVTELKVVNDPFGRGREMVNVAGRDKKPGPGGGKVGPAGAAGKGAKKGPGPSKREMIEMRERVMHPSRLRKKKTVNRSVKRTELTERKASKRVIKMKDKIVVSELAHELGVKVTDIISKLMSLGMMVAQNQSIDFETAQLIAADFEYKVDSTAFDEEEQLDVTAEEDEAPEDMKTRPPVVTVMGHVDHGKTSLLDAIRKARVAEGEAGGITQHIGAYSVNVPGKGSVTFLDTPGHAAFTQMRARGAQATDLVILVVAADDGVMPQTEEAIKHAQAAEVPIIVAVNKIDKPEAQPDRVMQELTKFNLVPEAWGGEVIFVNTSAVKGTGIPELLEAVLLQAEVLELKANPDRQAVGVVLEAKLDKGRGPVATVLVQQGTLKRGDAVVVGEFAGRVRAMTNDQGKMSDEAGPSAAVEVIGLEGVPLAGDTLHAVDTPEKAREIAEHRQQLKRAAEGQGRAAMSLDDILKRMKAGETLELRVVLKADVHGSNEALKEALSKLSTDEVKVTVVYSGVGGISESDITLAAASKGIVIGFGVRPDANSRAIAEREGVEIRSYNIIYEAIDDVRKAMEGLLAPEIKEKVVGHAHVREVFRITKVGQVAGCMVTDGKAVRSARVRVLRDNKQVFEGKVAALKRFKDDVREVDVGAECGVSIENYNEVKQNDVIEFYTIEEIARTLSSPPQGKRPAGGGASAHA